MNKKEGDINEKRYDWDSIASALRAQGLTDREIELAQLSFQKGIRLLLKMYHAYEAKCLERRQKEGKENML